VSLVVLKCGGAMASESAPAILQLADAGHDVCVVHGAGPQISEEMERFGIPVEFVEGRRVTSEAGLAVVRSSFAAVNRALSIALGARAVGLFGDKIGLHAVQIPALGCVGDPLPSRPQAIVEALSDGHIPVVAPLAVGPLNVNADEAAAALAIGFEADRLLFVTDVAGVFHDGSVLTSIAASDADRLVVDGTFAGGIVPKLRAAAIAARNGVLTEIGETAVVV
jgi:acetylglutamate kinase